jgi:hypothetical protein
MSLGALLNAIYLARYHSYHLNFKNCGYDQDMGTHYS